MQGRVAKRLNDTVGSEQLLEHLSNLSLTEMGHDSLKAVLSAEVPETRDWAAGEALAEAILEEQHDVVLPWNNNRDKRNPFASLPGADIVGFQRDGESFRLALGEVKCSSEGRWPPQVMYGRSGMTHQLEVLAGDLETIFQLLYWLLPRVKNTEFEEVFNTACTRYLNSGSKDVVLFGVLVRDQEHREQDLMSRGKHLSGLLNSPTNCRLIALYLPWPLEDLPDLVANGQPI